MQPDDLAGYVLSRPALTDAPAIHGLVRAYDLAAVGYPDTTVADIVDELADPAFDLERDGWLVWDGAGELAGWGWACRKAASDNVDIDVYARPGADEVAAWLWDAAVRRAAGIAAELGHRQAVVSTGTFRSDEWKRAAAAARGFAVAATFHRLRIDHVEPVPVPRPPAGVTLHTGDTGPGDASILQAAYRIHQVAFAGQFGFVPRRFADWMAHVEAAGSYDWRLLKVAAVDGTPAAMLLAGNQFVPDTDCGYVRLLAVQPEYRGRGLAKYLLRCAFAEDSRLGRRGTLLHVDTDNATAALDLYLGIGMRPVLVIDLWQRTVPAGDTPTAGRWPVRGRGPGAGPLPRPLSSSSARRSAG